MDTLRFAAHTIPGTTFQVYHQLCQRIGTAVGQVCYHFLSVFLFPEGIFLHTHLISGAQQVTSSAAVLHIRIPHPFWQGIR